MRGSHRTMCALRWSCVLMAAAPMLAPAQSRETLETKVSVSGDRVTLEWSAKHPWDRILLASAPSLLAEYRTEGGTLALDCLMGAGTLNARGRGGCPGIQGVRERGAQTRALVYRLPASLAAVPTGNACLLFRMPDQRPLPLRRVDRDRSETARFSYGEWDAMARSSVEAESRRRERDEARRALGAKQAEVAAAELRNVQKGWTSTEACQAVSSPDLSAEPSLRPIAERTEFEVVARQVCVMRARNAGERFSSLSLIGRLQRGVVHPPSVLDSVMSRIRQARGSVPVLSPERQQQLARYRHDWNQLADQVPRYRDDIKKAGYTDPHFGEFGDLLSLQGMAAQAGATVAASFSSGQPPDPQFSAGWIGGNLEAYSRCVVDGEAQVETSYSSAAELEQRRPALQEGARQALVKLCTGGVESLAALRAQLLSLESRAEAAERALAGIGTPPALPTRAREVNESACVP